MDQRSLRRRPTQGAGGARRHFCRHQASALPAGCLLAAGAGPCSAGVSTRKGRRFRSPSGGRQGSRAPCKGPCPRRGRPKLGNALAVAAGGPEPRWAEGWLREPQARDARGGRPGAGGEQEGAPRGQPGGAGWERGVCERPAQRHARVRARGGRAEGGRGRRGAVGARGGGTGGTRGARSCGARGAGAGRGRGGGSRGARPAGGAPCWVRRARARGRPGAVRGGRAESQPPRGTAPASPRARPVAPGARAGMGAPAARGERCPRPGAELSLRSPRKEDGAQARAVRGEAGGLIPSGMKGSAVAVCSPGPPGGPQVERMVTDHHSALRCPDVLPSFSCSP